MTLLHRREVGCDNLAILQMQHLRYSVRQQSLCLNKNIGKEHLRLIKKTQHNQHNNRVWVPICSKELQMGKLSSNIS